MWTDSATAPTVLTDSGSSGEIEAVSIPYPTAVPTTSDGEQAPQFFRITVSSN